jgi:glyoxylate/hydroxypyruvate reductase A
MTVAIPFLAAPGYASTGAWMAALQQAMPHERITLPDAMTTAERAQCEVAIVANPSPADVAGFPQLKWVHSVWAGVERLLAELPASDLRIVRLVDPQLADTMAEAVLTWVLYLHRDVAAYARQQTQRVWNALDYVRPEHRTVGILGMGALGRCAAQRLLQAKFRVLGWSREATPMPGVEAFAGSTGLQAMLEQTDIAVCLLPLTPATTGLLNAQTLGWLPNGASLINFARGPIVNDIALQAALDAGRLQHAVLDVFNQEPLPPAQWQWAHPRVSVLPHCSGPTDRATASAIVADNIRKFRATGEMPTGVDRHKGY